MKDIVFHCFYISVYIYSSKLILLPKIIIIAAAKNKIETIGKYRIEAIPKNIWPVKLPKLAPKFCAVVLKESAVSRYLFVNFVINITPSGPVTHCVAFHKNRVIQKIIILILEMQSVKMAVTKNKINAYW